MNVQNFWNEEWIRLLKTKAEAEDIRDIRVLTLHQPSAFFVAVGLKKIETRSKPINSFRGKVLIQSACQKMSYAEVRKYTEIMNMAVCRKMLPIEKIPFPEQLPLGSIVAIADLTDCKMMNMAEEGESKDPDFAWMDDQSELELAVGDWRIGRYAWKLENIIAAPTPIPYKNGQGLQRLKIARLLLSGQENL